MPRPSLTGHTRFLLLDANVVAGYYLPESLNSRRARERVPLLFDSVRNGWCPEIFLYIPNLCIAEVFVVFAKYRFAKWHKDVKKNLPSGLSADRYVKLRKDFQSDLHNGKLLQQVELNRYHVFASDLISPVDAHYEHYRGKKNKRMMQTVDHLIIGMGIQLAKVHGRDNFAIVTSDHRFTKILEKAWAIGKATATELGLIERAQGLGFQEYGKHVYPNVVDLASARNSELEEFLGMWPLPAAAPPPGQNTSLRPDHVRLLLNLLGKKGITSDRLPYSPEFEDILRRFEHQANRPVSRQEAWWAILNARKAKKMSADSTTPLFDGTNGKERKNG